MSGATAVYLKSGDQPRAFAFGNSVTPIYSITANQSSLPLYKEAVYSTFQGILLGTGVITATINILGSNDDDTGRGIYLPSSDAPGALIKTTAASATITPASGNFPASLVGTVISAPGVPVGTTVSAVAANGVSLTASAAATATGTVQANFYANNWVKTALGTITLNSTGPSSDGFAIPASWRYVQAVVSNITGAGVAGVKVLMGV